MSLENRAKTLFTVESTGDFIHHQHHARFCVHEQLHFREDSFVPESMPSSGEFNTPAPEVHNKTYLHFTVDNIGDQGTFVFGGDSTSCDVHIVTDRPISSRLFAVELQNSGRTALLKNLSSRGISVSSRVYGKIKVRSQRALVPADELKISLSEFDISIIFLDHEDQLELHEFYLQQLGHRLSEAVPGINQLDLRSKDSSTRARRDTSYNLLNELGSGAFGTVYRATHSFTGDLVAVKVFHKPMQNILKEAAILQSLSHANIVRFIEFISLGQQQGPSMMVMELLEHPNLEDALEEQPFRTNQVRDLLSELLHGLAYLHSMHITHRDLKPANIILVSRTPMSIKLTDFGVATERSANLETRCGTPLYMAPEIQGRNYSNKVDIWSVGVIALWLVTGLPDYPKKPALWPRMLQDRLEAAALDIPCYFLIDSMLQLDANRRPSAQQTLEDSFFNDSFFNVQLNSIGSVSSPTQYAPTPREYRVRSSSSTNQTRVTAAQPRHRSQNAPSPEDNAFETRIFAPLDGNPTQAPAQASTEVVAPAPVDVPASVVVVAGRATTYWKLCHNGKTVMYRPADRFINVTQLIQASGHSERVRWSSLTKRLGNIDRVVVNGRYIIGSYVSMQDARRVLQFLQLPEASIEDLSRRIAGHR